MEMTNSTVEKDRAGDEELVPKRNTHSVIWGWSQNTLKIAYSLYTLGPHLRIAVQGGYK